MKKLSFFVLLILLLVIISHVHSQRPPPPAKPALMWYVLSWPPTFCIGLNNNVERPVRCKEPIPQHEFTLHGLWPADANGITISCDIPVNEDWDKLFRSIENKLVTFWPTLIEDQAQRNIWKHEWKHHGICGGTTSKEYFAAAISINDKIKKGNLFYYLKTSGIIACDSLAFTKDEIVKAVQKVFIGNVPPPPPPPPGPPPPPPRSPPPPPGPPPPPPPPPSLNVYLRCVQIDDKNKTHGYLNEVVLCTTLKGTGFVTCPQQGTPTNCNTYQKIMLPHPKPQRHLRFVLRWPPTFCIELNSQRGRCKEPIPQDGFTLHGLWQADGQGKINKCPVQPDPTWDQVFTSTTEKQLTTFWLPLKEKSQKRDLWIEEWRLHGCVGETAQVYFDIAIKINNMIKDGNLFNYLKRSGIIASDTLGFPEKDIVVAIQKVFVNVPFNVYLTCIDSGKKGFVYLKEVTLCTNLVGTSFVSCPPQLDDGINTCSSGAKIMLPLRKPQKVLQEETDGIYPTFE